MIYSPANDIDDDAKKMAAHIRLFVNLSRKGTSVTTEIVGHGFTGEDILGR